MILTTRACGRKKKTPCAAGEEVRCAGRGVSYRAAFAANLGGMFIHFGQNVCANFDFTLVDDAPIYVGDGTLFGPNVTLTTAGHPIDPERRAAGYIFCEPIDSYRQKLLDRRGQHRYARYSGRRRRIRQPVQGYEEDLGAG